MTIDSVLGFDKTTASNNVDVNGVGIQGSSSLASGNDAIQNFMKLLGVALTRHVVKTVGSYTPAKADHNQFWRCTGAVTLNLTAAATLTDGWCLWVRANGGAVTIDPNSTELIDGASTLVLADGQSALIVCTGTAFFAEFTSMAGASTVSRVVQQVFTGSGTYTPTAGMLYCIAEAVGAGGGGGGAKSAVGKGNGAGGGGAGEYARSRFTAAQIGASKAVVIGAGGAAGTSGPTAGSNGTATTLGTTLLVANGGNGGDFSSAGNGVNGGSGGGGGTGDFLIIGGPGFPGSGHDNVGNHPNAGSGGASYFGGGPRGDIRNSTGSTAGNQTGGALGSGGSGGVELNQASGVAGGAGRDGCMIITEYCS